jgi:hypothetical protein
LEDFLLGTSSLFLPGRFVDEIEPPALISLKLKNGFFEKEAAPLDRSPENGKNPYPQHQPFRSEQIKALRSIFDAHLLKGHSHPSPEAQGGFPNEDLSSENFAQLCLNECAIEFRVKESMKGQEGKNTETRDKDESQEKNDLLSKVHHENNTIHRIPRIERPFLSGFNFETLFKASPFLS